MSRPREVNGWSRKLAVDVAAWWLAAPVAYLLRFDGTVPAQFAAGWWFFLAASLVVKTGAALALRLSAQSWSQVSFRDMVRIGQAVAIVAVVQALLVLAVREWVIVPRSVLMADAIVGVVALIAVRAVRRAVFQRGRDRLDLGRPKRRVLLVGSGEAALVAAREMTRTPRLGLVPVGFLDDAPERRGTVFDGVRVLGPVDDLPRVAAAEAVDEVIVASEGSTGPLVRRVVELIDRSGLPLRHRVLPNVFEVLSGEGAVQRIRDVRIEDLLRRSRVERDVASVRAYVAGATVMVTGAGGSIGSELVRQLSQAGPARIVLLGRGENGIFEIERELRSRRVTVDLATVICDVRDRDRLERVFAHQRPDVVFHAAAHKHVPLMEVNPEEAILNNVIGTRNVAELAADHGVRRFVNVSTDKAVNPSSMMGATKRVGEAIVADVARRVGGERSFVSVRFGNVLGSRGSVIPTFQAQIAAGGPITVTHPDMRRYFMTIPEAVQLVLHAGAVAHHGEVFVLDMGEPVRIVDLAEDLIRLSGLEPGVDIDIVFSGARPGEKLEEELMTELEQATATGHSKLFVARTAPPPNDLRDALAALESLAKSGRAAESRAALFALVERLSGAPTGGSIVVEPAAAPMEATGS